MNRYEINGPWIRKPAIIARPRGGEWLADDLRQIKHEGFDVLVSLLTPAEVKEFDLVREEEISKAVDLEFVSLPIPDLGVPQSTDAFGGVVDHLIAALQSGKKIAIHCRQGIGRSGLLAAALLMCSGIDPEVAIQRVSEARGLTVPETKEQKEWITKFAEDFVDTLAKG
jgi:protein-tyrosine phosphatase